MRISAELKKHELAFCIFSSLIVGLIAFLLTFGAHPVNPSYTDWIYNYNAADLKGHFLGWCFFRTSPWTFPVGLFDSLSYPFKTSILNTDSIPLFAIFFKMLSPILPKNFQYWGLWILSCFMLQSLLGMIIIRKYTKKDLSGNIISVLSGLLFAFLPVLSLVSFRHSSVACHWLILASCIPFVYRDELSFKQKLLIFSFIGLLTGAINPYMTAICGIIILAYSIYEVVSTKKPVHFGYVFLFCAFSLLSLYFIGAFSQNAYGTNLYLYESSFNLNGFLNSQGTGRFLNFKINSIFQTIGYAYFGIGILLLIIVSGISCLVKICRKKFEIQKKELITFIILILISIFLALSPRATIGEHILYELPLPDYIVNFWSVFRCTGRFIWIANYLILISVLIYLVKNFSNKTIYVLLSLAVILQFTDTDPIRRIRKIPYPDEVVTNNLNNDLFNNLSSKENNIKYIIFDKTIYDLPDEDPGFSIIMSLANWAKDKDIKLSYFYFGRNLKGLDNYYFNEVKNPSNNEVFVFYNYDDYLERTKNNTFDYSLYVYENLIFARIIPISGWEELKIN